MLRQIASHEEERKKFQETLSQEKQKLARQLAEKTRVLEEKDAKISQIGEQLSKAREGLATKAQVRSYELSILSQISLDLILYTIVTVYLGSLLRSKTLTN